MAGSRNKKKNIYRLYQINMYIVKIENVYRSPIRKNQTKTNEIQYALETLFTHFNRHRPYEFERSSDRETFNIFRRVTIKYWKMLR